MLLVLLKDKPQEARSASGAAEANSRGGIKSTGKNMEK
jgi:hypothetical protein